ncbi:MAG TPA: hypothetical protein VFZ03_09230 [Dongiaceae bacterium]
MSRAINSPDHSKLPIIVRIGLCRHRRRRHGLANPKRATSRKQERRISRRGAL